jgi:hypothetical protein
MAEDFCLAVGGFPRLKAPLAEITGGIVPPPLQMILIDRPWLDKPTVILTGAGQTIKLS